MLAELLKAQTSKNTNLGTSARQALKENEESGNNERPYLQAWSTENGSRP